jgi:glycosyltransferase involved in cell wall biosynthesis
MRIALDLSGVRTTGTIVYTEGFLPAFSALLDRGDELIIFGPPKLKDLISSLAGENARFIVNSAAASVPIRICWQQVVLPRLLSELKVDVLFEPYDIGPWYCNCPMVLGIRNPIPVFLAERTVKLSWRLWLSWYLHQALVRGACRKAQALIFPSRYAAERVGGLLGTPIGKRRVVCHGLDIEFWQGTEASEALPAGTDPATCCYILFASKFYAQKRASLLLEAFHAWRERHGRSDYRLVFCGEDKRSPAAEAVLRRVRELGLDSAVHVLGTVERPVLRDLYRKASLCALPTVMETFGFPYVEAMAAGIPLVCADIEIARELCGDAAYYFRPDDREALVAALENACHDTPARRSKLAEGSARAAGFSWRREAEETLACLRAGARVDLRAGVLV